MIISNETNEFLNGNKFSNGLEIAISKKENQILYREDYICQLVEKKKIIHIGCVDHIPLIVEKIKNDTWLHKLITEKATRCLGIDINEEGISYIKEIGYKDAICLNIISDKIPQNISEESWDIAIMGEILEHVDNPVLFLQQLKEKFSPFVKELVITVPSALRLKNIKMAFKHKEFINTDHRFWFTPYTLAKVAACAGLKTIDFQMVNSYKPNGILTKFLLKKFPALREVIVMKISLK